MIRITRHPACLVLIVLALGLAGGEAGADNGMDCLKSQCEAAGRSCVETLYSSYNACMAAGNKKCFSAQPSEKFDCLKSALSPCALTRNDQETACLEGVRACSATCSPPEGQRVRYWCVAEFGDNTTAAFCLVNPQSGGLMNQCDGSFDNGGQAAGSMTCDPL